MTKLSSSSPAERHSQTRPKTVVEKICAESVSRMKRFGGEKHDRMGRRYGALSSRECFRVRGISFPWATCPSEIPVGPLPLRSGKGEPGQPRRLREIVRAISAHEKPAGIPWQQQEEGGRCAG